MGQRVVFILILSIFALSACRASQPGAPATQTGEVAAGETAAAVAPAQGDAGPVDASPAVSGPAQPTTLVVLPYASSSSGAQAPGVVTPEAVAQTAAPQEQVSDPAQIVTSGPGSGQSPVPAPSTSVPLVPQPLTLTSPAFKEGELIPARHACDLDDLSPQLDWSGVPVQTRSLALIVDDPDAPGGEWVHWILYDLPPDLGGLPEDVHGLGVPGENDFLEMIYGGPCPPPGDPHHYFFKLYALDVMLNLPAGAPKAELIAAMQGHILAQGQLMGLYDR